jgi:hypothetical protein
VALFGRETPQDQARAESYARWLQSQNPFAVASLVLGVFSLIELGVLIVFGIAGIACGAVAIRQLNRPDSAASGRGRGRWLAWTGIITSALSLVIATLLYLRVLG